MVNSKFSINVIIADHVFDMVESTQVCLINSAINNLPFFRRWRTYPNVDKLCSIPMPRGSYSCNVKRCVPPTQKDKLSECLNTMENKSQTNLILSV